MEKLKYTKKSPDLCGNLMIQAICLEGIANFSSFFSSILGGYLEIYVTSWEFLRFEEALEISKE